MWEPMFLCAALQEMHSTTPRLTLAHSGPGAEQSAHTWLPSEGDTSRDMCRGSQSWRTWSFYSMYYDLLLIFVKVCLIFSPEDLI